MSFYHYLFNKSKRLTHLQAQPKNNYHQIFNDKRASLKASVSIEAALTLPVVLLALAILIQPITVMNTSRQMQTVCEDICKDVAASVCDYTKDSTDDTTSGSDNRDNEKHSGDSGGDIGTLALDALTSIALGKYAKEKALVEINDSRISNVDFMGTQFMLGDDMITVSLEYRYDLPFLELFGLDEVTQTVTASRRAWTGRKGSGGDSDELEGDDIWVYIAKHGTRYHLSSECRYLNTEGMSSVSYEAALASGKTFCERCGRTAGPGDTVYVFSGGSKYHLSDKCKVDVPWVKKVKKSDVEYMGACKVCGK